MRCTLFWHMRSAPLNTLNDPLTPLWGRTVRCACAVPALCTRCTGAVPALCENAPYDHPQRPSENEQKPSTFLNNPELPPTTLGSRQHPEASITTNPSSQHCRVFDHAVLSVAISRGVGHNTLSPAMMLCFLSNCCVLSHEPACRPMRLHIYFALDQDSGGGKPACCTLSLCGMRSTQCNVMCTQHKVHG